MKDPTPAGPTIPGPLPDTHMPKLKLPDWIPDAAMRQKVLVDNPARLYGFQPAQPAVDPGTGPA